MLNEGQWKIRSADMPGNILVINGGDGSISVTSEPEIGSSYVAVNSPMFNFGSISLEEQDIPATMDVYGGIFFNSGGEIFIGRGNRFVNGTHLINNGSITAAEGSELMNFDLIDTGSHGWLELADGAWQGGGIVTYMDDTRIRISKAEADRHVGRQAAFAWEGIWQGVYSEEELMCVSSEEELRKALEDPKVGKVCTPFNTPITVEGDLAVDNKMLVTDGPLTVNGTLTVSGDQGLLWNRYGIEARELLARDSAMAIVFGELAPDMVTLQSGAVLYTNGDNVTSDFDINADGGSLIFGGRQTLSGSTLTLEGGANLNVNGRLELMGCGVSVGEGCWFGTNSGDLVMDPGCTVTNSGEMSIYGYSWNERVLCGSIENLGRIRLNGGVLLGPSGSFVNRGELELDCGPDDPVWVGMSLENQGSVTRPNGGAGFVIEDGGSVSGVPEELLG